MAEPCPVCAGKRLRPEALNVFLGKAGIRPEWIGLLESTADLRDITYVGRMSGVGNLADLPLEEARTKYINISSKNCSP